MIKRFSNARKGLRLSIYLIAFLTVYFVAFSAILPREPSDFGRESLLEFVYSDVTPINFDHDDGRYVGQVINYRIEKDFKTFGSLETSDDDVCLFTQLSTDRLDALIELAASWNSYISVALYIEHENQVDYLIEQLEEKLSGRLSSEARMDLSLLYAYDITRQKNSTIHPYDLLYPINALRNLALKQCKSQYAFSLDVDFSVSQNTREVIDMNKERLLKSKSPLALVVPVFEWIFEKEVMPTEFGMTELRFYCSTGRMVPFHSKRLNRIRYSKQDLKDWCYGNSSSPKHLKITRVQNLTDYTKWLSATDIYKVSKKPNVLDLYYEPYFISRKDLIPLFSERFRGYGFNKRANAMAMQYAGFDFMVLPEAFAVHRYHPHSNWRTQLKHDLLIQKTLGRTFDLYKLELKEQKLKKAGWTLQN